MLADPQIKKRLIRQQRGSETVIDAAYARIAALKYVKRLIEHGAVLSVETVE